VQLICVGPLVDVHGRFASIKFLQLMKNYPDRIRSIPEFRILPQYVMEGADFCLIPSRDEPFGLVAVESGRKGALGIGSKLGGLGLSPGWVSEFICPKREPGSYAVAIVQWYPVESNTTTHLLSQLNKTIRLALRSKPQDRAFLRARAAVQRFPVVEVSATHVFLTYVDRSSPLTPNP
jgi:alpha-1,3-glucan synthase